MTTMPSYDEYGNHPPVFPPVVDETNAELEISPEVRLRLYEIQQQVRQFEKRAYDLFL
jgi:pyruvate dehydrogenase E1 component alpha subunit